MFYIPNSGDTRYKRKIVLFPININGVRYAWQIIYVKQYRGVCYWHDDIVVDKEIYLNWKKGKKTESWNRKEVWDAIHKLSDIRAGYSLFDKQERSKYHACSLAIQALREVIGEPTKE